MKLDKQSISENRAKRSRREFVASASALILSGSLLLQGCARSSSSHSSARLATRQPSHSKISVIPLDYDASEGFAKLNAIRTKHLLPEFRVDPRLQKAAQDYANLMGTRGLYGHEIGPGTDFKSRIHAVGYNNSSGENIGVGYRSIDDALEGWMNSSGHRKNMLKRRYTLAGLAYGFNTSGINPRYTHYWVLIMGKADRAYS
ncbi:MAG: CAP domain-containing protein [Hyphomicrobiales bacterium]|nr:CAP domain-containing protein [Hyphomicrobiales bacterium]